MLFQRTDCLHHRTFKVGADTHYFTGGLHLCGEGSLGGNELIERKTRELDYTVVKGRLKACIGLTCDRVLISSSVYPRAILAATLAMGYPVALLARADERLTRGLTSITQYSKLVG